MSVLKIKDGNSWVNIPASGVGVPLGGNAGDVLTKASATDYDAGWVTPVPFEDITSEFTWTSNVVQKQALKIGNLVLLRFQGSRTASSSAWVFCNVPASMKIKDTRWTGYGFSGANNYHVRIYGTAPDIDIRFEGGVNTGWFQGQIMFVIDAPVIS